MPGPQPARRPVSSYRLQLNAEFPFAEAEKVVPYLERLGITECYSSPILTARPGSQHGYDTCDHSHANPELGGDEGFCRFAVTLRQHRMGLIVDFVPNHMSVDPEANQWWRSVLENGPSSPFAKFFDVDWDPVKAELKGRVLLPILGDQYGVALESGNLRIEFCEGDLRLRYFDVNLPLNPRQIRLLLGYNLDSLQAVVAADDPHLMELQSIQFHLDNLPVYTNTEPDQVELRQREKQIAKQRLARLAEESPRIREHIEANVQLFNGVPGNSKSFDLLHELLELQVYRLAYWRTATHEINYRRFFDINELAGIRMEEPEVFRQAHIKIGEWIQSGDITGLRLDHVDGLFDPREYLESLAALAGSERPIYVVVEKILSESEPLPLNWKAQGTTGYEFMNDVNGIFVDQRSASDFRKLYQRFTRKRRYFHEVVYESKKLIISTSMASELNVLAHELNRISESHRRSRDFTLDSLQEALREIVACFPVYRTYFGPDGYSELDSRSVDAAVARALWRNPAMEPSIFHFIRQMLLPVRTPDVPEEEFQRRVRFAMKFQQYTGPVQAKGVEDTAFYRYAPLLSLNEVGGDPARFGRSLDEFHRTNRDRLATWPLAMLSTSTHDSKRGEDCRARINVLSEIPAEWQSMISRWSKANAGVRTRVLGEPAPDRGDEYLFYQALIGAWPAGLDGPPDAEFVDRMRNYMQKALREEKVHTSWINPSPEYDGAVSKFVESALTGTSSRSFLPLFLPFQQKIARLGMLNSLAQVVLKTTSPGVPDFYRGTEMWDLNLVDPDNRRPLDFSRRAALLEKMEPILDESAPVEERTRFLADLFEHWEDGRIKMYYTAAGLRFRRRHSEMFLSGEYRDLQVEGENAHRLVAYSRRLGSQRTIVVAARLVATLVGENAALPAGPQVWGNTQIRLPEGWPAGPYSNVFTGAQVSGGTLRAGDVLKNLPSVILHGDTSKEVR